MHYPYALVRTGLLLTLGLMAKGAWSAPPSGALPANQTPSGTSVLMRPVQAVSGAPASAAATIQPAPLSPTVTAQTRTSRVSQPLAVQLDALTHAELTQLRAQGLNRGGPLQLGTAREVAQLKKINAASQLTWEARYGGLAAAISVNIPGAYGLRLGLSLAHLPDAAILRFYGPASSADWTVPATEINATIARNLAAGDPEETARIYWSPVIEGTEAWVEIELPAGVQPGELSFSLPQVSELYAPVLEPQLFYNKASGSCNLDATCYVSSWPETAGVAKMVFTVSGSSYLCSGTLMNDTDASTNIPYFLTANHCISTQTSASSLQTYWFYRSSSCGGSGSNSYQTLSGGATLLYASATSDTSFMRLSGTLPAGIWFSGWSISLPALSTAITGIHHPSGDLQKISFGTLTNYEDCTDGSGGYTCSTVSAAAADHYQVVWSQGITEGGSSGSGLWVTDAGNHYLVGTLHGGASYCSAPYDPDDYGRFDLAYNAALSQWLSPTTGSTYALTVSKTGSGTVTSSPSGINCGSTCSASYASGTSVTLTATPASGYSFSGWSGDCSGTGTCTLGMSAARSVTATFTATAGSCTIGSISVGQTANDSLTSGCNSTYRTGAYAKFYSFTLSAAQTVTVNLSSTIFDTYLILRSGNSTTGTVVAANDDIVSGNSNSQLVQSLAAGTYTLEVSSYYSAMTGAFTLSLSGTGGSTNYTLTVSKTGSGTVTSSPSGISCGSTCSASYTSGTSVTLTATPSSGYTFSGWGGDCSGTSTCSLSMAAARSVSATFTATSGGTGNAVFHINELTGFTDSTPVSPVGGNSGTTVGAQRSNVFQAAAQWWAQRLNSAVTIQVDASFSSLSCNTSSATLGSAGPNNFFVNFAQAPRANTWYASALANALAGTDLDSTSADISANFNKDIGGANCLAGQSWYYGLDGNPASNQIDLFQVILHEFGHGLGFLTLVDDSGQKYSGYDDAFMVYLEDHSTGRTYNQMTDSERYSANRRDGQLHWAGSDVLNAMTVLTAGTSGGHVQMYAPTVYQSGSSVSHWDTRLTPSEMMEPSYTDSHPISDLTLAAMQDMGWTVAGSGGSTNYTLTVSKTGSGTVTSSPSGISCGSTCSASYASGTSVTLTATPASGYSFSGWSGACSGTSSTCTLSMTAAHSVSASFSGGNTAAITTLITYYYQSILERGPEASGLAYYQDRIAAAQAAGQDVKPEFRLMAYNFFNSPEYLNRNTADTAYITTLYVTFLQRHPEDAGLAYYLARLNTGESRNVLIDNFVNSSEFDQFMTSLGL